MIRNRAVYQVMGARFPKGILLYSDIRRIREGIKPEHVYRRMMETAESSVTGNKNWEENNGYSEEIYEHFKDL